MEKKLINNSYFMEFIDEVCTQMLELEFGEHYHKQGKGTDDDTLYLTDDAQEFYNDKYDEIEKMANNIMGVYSDIEF